MYLKEGTCAPNCASTYGAGGSNGNSRLRESRIEQMQLAGQFGHGGPLPPGPLRAIAPTCFYGALYHWFVLFSKRRRIANSARTAACSDQGVPALPQNVAVDARAGTGIGCSRRCASGLGGVSFIHWRFCKLEH